MTSSIEETHASKPQAPSSLMNYLSKEFIQIDKRKWNDIDVYLGRLTDDSAGKPVATEENQVICEFSESQSWSVHEDEVTG